MEKEKDTPKISYLHVISRIQSRFATTLIASQLENVSGVAKEAVFTVTLPNAAFISNFTMCVDGKTIVGEVKEKQEAKVQYDKAKARGESAGHIAKSPRETNVFTISTNISAGGQATFNLTYQEVLQRVHGVYKHVLNIQPGQIVEDLKIDVFIAESKEITKVHVPKFGAKVGEKTNQELVILEEEIDVKVEYEKTDSSSNVHITYYPSVECQKQEGFQEGQLVVLYDVKREGSGSELQVVNGYFIHFFAPTGIEPANKHVIFVIDKSGSMSGSKIQQTKEAMRVILKDLNDNDRFNIITFNTHVGHWKEESVRATKAAVNRAIIDLDGIHAEGGTDINQALKDALCMLTTKWDNNELNNSMVILLTDGQPTVGECSIGRITANVREQNQNMNAIIHCLGFGQDADYDLLKKLSIENQGLARKIYEDSDAALQLQGFYTEVSQLLLSNVTIHYVNETLQPDSIICDSNRNYYAGSECTVVGKLHSDSTGGDFEVIDENSISGLTAQISAMGIGGEQQFESVCQRPVLPQKTHNLPLPPESVGGFVERMWAYLTIKQLLDNVKYKVSESHATLKDKALQLSLKYQFVTELTSMVVTQPDKETEVECEIEEFNDSQYGHSEFDIIHNIPPQFYQQQTMLCLTADSGWGPGYENWGEAQCLRRRQIDINLDLAQMSLNDIVNLDWITVAPKLTSATINSLSMSTLCAIPWDLLFQFLPTEVITALTSPVLQTIPPTAWNFITLETWLALKPEILASLPITTLKNVPHQFWTELPSSSLAAFDKETVKSVKVQLIEKDN